MRGNPVLDVDRFAEFLADLERRLTALEKLAHVHKGGYTTAGRPSAVTLGDGAQIYDTTLNKPVWSDGTVWRDAAGTAV